MEHNPRSATHAARVGALMLATTFLAGCNLGVLDLAGGNLQKVSLSGPSVVQVGDTIRLTASGSVDGLLGLMFLDRLLDARFTVSDPTVASISPFIPPKGDTTSFASVLVQGRKVGRVNVTVTDGSKSDTHPVDVVAPTP